MSDLSGKRVACYARFSTDKQSTSSIADQVAKVARAVEARGGRLDHKLVFKDEAISGAVWERPGLHALIAAVEAKRLEVLVVEDLGRISRDVEDSARFRKRLAYAGVRLIALDDGIDTASEGAELMGDVLSSFKALYRREIASKTRRGMEGKARAGFSTGRLPYGYTSKPGANGFEILIHEEQAAVVREIFAMYKDGLSLGGVARALNARRIEPPATSRTRIQHSWSVSCVRSVLHNSKYVGDFSYGRRKWERDPETRNRLPRKRDKALVASARPELAIISRETWNAVRLRFEESGGIYAGYRRVPGKGKRLYPLSGILRCAHCSNLLSVTGGVEDRRYYRCSGAVRGDCELRSCLRESIVRTRIIGAIRDRFAARTTRELLEQLIEDESKALENGDERKQLTARLARNETKARRLVDAIAEGDSPTIVLATLRDLERCIADDRRALASRSPRRAFRVPNLRDLLSELDALFAGPAETVRTSLAKLLDGGRIDVRREDDGKHYARGALLPAVLLGREVTWVAGAGFEPTTFGL